MSITAGLDVGGAHLKVALAENGRAIAVQQFVCPLWHGLDILDVALRDAQTLLSRADRFAVTMTGELSDLFPDRATGVATLVERVVSELGSKTQIWMGPAGFGTPTDAAKRPADVGSTNFLATAALAGRSQVNALVIDFGTTTVDLIPVVGGRAVPTGLTDAVRQETGELVYTGLTRTAVMAVADRAPFNGKWVSLAREYLATMADVRRTLGDDLTELDLHATADGKGKSVEESTLRFARMLGRDAADGSDAAWQIAASYVRDAQLRSIHDGALAVLSAHLLSDDVPIVAAGVGAYEIEALATRLNRDVMLFGDLAGVDHDPHVPRGLHFWATACAPAVSVALLCDAA